MPKFVSVLGSITNGYSVRMDMTHETINFASLADHVWHHRSGPAHQAYKALVDAGRVTTGPVDIKTAMELLEDTCPSTKMAQAALKKFKRQGGRKSLETAKENHLHMQIQRKAREEQKEIALTQTRLKIKEAYDATQKLVHDFSEVVTGRRWGEPRIEALKDSIRPLAELCFKLEMKN